MKYDIKFTDTAKSDLRDIAIYIAEQSKSKEIAIEFINELREQCGRLESFPLSGAFPKDRILKSAGYRYIIHKDYLIFYSIDEQAKTAYIEAVFNSRKDYFKVLRNMMI